MKNRKLLYKMLEYVDKIMGYIQNADYESFENNKMMVEACVFNLSQIGELVNKFDTEFISTHADIPWNKIRGLRNRIIHDYEGINLKLIWEIITADLYKLKKQLIGLITDKENNG
ncbi:MAG TPA: HepT-like ribonuclease domain-containing protein [Clostridia bacterium]